MGIMSDNPEFFEEFAVNRALNGDYGIDLQKKCEEGEIFGYLIWDMLTDKQRDEAISSAGAAYCERFVR